MPRIVKYCTKYSNLHVNTCMNNDIIRCKNGCITYYHLYNNHDKNRLPKTIDYDHYKYLEKNTIKISLEDFNVIKETIVEVHKKIGKNTHLILPFLKFAMDNTDMKIKIDKGILFENGDFVFLYDFSKAIKKLMDEIIK